MKTSRVIILIGAVGLVAIAAIGLQMTRAEAEAEHKHHHEAVETDTTKGNVKTKGFSINQIHSKHLPAVSKSIDKAIKAIKSGNSEAALAELHKAQKMLAAINKAIGKHEEAGHEHGSTDLKALPAGANQMCPMMPDEKVDPSLYVEYKGKRIYVCCKKCAKRVQEDPAAWYAKVYGDGHDHDH